MSLSVQNYNANNISRETLELMVYFEKHKILQICAKLFMEIGQTRPIDVRKWIAKHIREIANMVLCSRTIVYFRKGVDHSSFSKLMYRDYNIPTVIYNKKVTENNKEEIVRKFNKFVKNSHLEKKNIIFLDAPDEIPTDLIKPTLLLNVDSQHDCMECSEYPNRKCTLPCRCKNVIQANSNLDEMASAILSRMRHHKPECPYLRGGFCLRVVIFGREGSGRKTQARALAKRFNLVLITIESLIQENLNKSDESGKFFRANFKVNKSLLIFKILYEKLLRKECQKNGWVLVGFPQTAEDFQILMEKFFVQPNKIVFLHCRERVALKRCRKAFDRKGEWMKCVFDNQKLRDKMEFFNLNKLDILAYLSKYKETIHIDGNHSSQTVKSNIWSRVNSEQIAVGITKRTRRKNLCISSKIV